MFWGSYSGCNKKFGFIFKRQTEIDFERRLGNLALAIALVSQWVCAAMACAKCAVGENLSKLPARGHSKLLALSSNVILLG